MPALMAAVLAAALIAAATAQQSPQPCDDGTPIVQTVDETQWQQAINASMNIVTDGCNGITHDPAGGKMFVYISTTNLTVKDNDAGFKSLNEMQTISFRVRTNAPNSLTRENAPFLNVYLANMTSPNSLGKRVDYRLGMDSEVATHEQDGNLFADFAVKILATSQTEPTCGGNILKLETTVSLLDTNILPVVMFAVSTNSATANEDRAAMTLTQFTVDGKTVKFEGEDCSIARPGAPPPPATPPVNTTMMPVMTTNASVESPFPPPPSSPPVNTTMVPVMTTNASVESPVNTTMMPVMTVNVSVPNSTIVNVSVPNSTTSEMLDPPSHNTSEMPMVPDNVSVPGPVPVQNETVIDSVSEPISNEMPQAMDADSSADLLDPNTTINPALPTGASLQATNSGDTANDTLLIVVIVLAIVIFFGGAYVVAKEKGVHIRLPTFYTASANRGGSAADMLTLL